MRSFILLCFSLSSLSAVAASERVFLGEVKVVQGAASNGGYNIAVGDKVFVGDTVSTEKRSFLRIKLADGSGAFQLGPASTIKFSPNEKSATTIDLIKGYILSTLKPAAKPSDEIRYQVRTKVASMGVRGTTFFARADSKHKTFQCICEGRVESTWKNGKETWESKHHETRHIFSKNKAESASMDLPTNHTDEEIAELKKLID